MSAELKQRQERAELWRRYRTAADPESWEALIREHLPLVRYLAGRLVVHLPPQVELDDLISYGIFGLMEAIKRYDPSRGVKFETYAYTRIRGAMLDGLRAMDWVPQGLRRRAREVEACYRRLENRLGRPAEDAEVAAELGLTPDEFGELLKDLARTTVISLDDVLRSESDDPAAVLDRLADPGAADPLAAATLADLRQRLAQALAVLPERERLVITLYYYEGLTVKEIAEVMGVSPSRVSQLHTRAILRLRARLGGDGG
ncbi:FliA/WhiG family RNA polymerase sigma factor [Thermaerobacter subterraneus]|uniref:RNA polymerase sigma factor n=1 Tax=Thermaerobacter subterraneus DSM 13965 TaxID=867903 RepID=K6PYQ5_9FIRM|nr:FliA/WhiG family RNA polymerase sigma factor [Thermaerobacter subterraneus]EKP93659.1 RNA polymerase, sigma 28 subunit, SigD/FliA/WhiG [Thermaerobacter subterraneus DSM 13965]